LRRIVEGNDKKAFFKPRAIFIGLLIGRREEVAEKHFVCVEAAISPKMREEPREHKGA